MLIRGRAASPSLVAIAPPRLCATAYCNFGNQPLVELPITTLGGQFWVSWTPPNRWLSTLDVLPDIGHWFPGPQRLRWHRLAVYRVLILSHRVCVLQRCYDAVLPDTVSPDDAQIAFDAGYFDPPPPPPAPGSGIGHTGTITATGSTNGGN